MKLGDIVKRCLEFRRAFSDLDSLTIGSPTKRQIKVYFNAKEDREPEVLRRVDLALSCLAYGELKLNALKNEDV